MNSMLRLFIIFIAAGMLNACQTGGNQSNQSAFINTLENADSNLSLDSLRSLQNMTSDYNATLKKPEDKAAALYELGLVMDRNRKFDRSANIMKELIQDYAETSYKERALFMLINVYKVKIRNPEIASVLSDFLLGINPEHENKIDLDENLGDDYAGADKIIGNIKNKALVKLDNGDVQVDRTNAKNLIFLSQMYTIFRPDGENAKQHLHDASEFARSIADNEQLLNILNLLIENYPSSKEGQEALFLKAFYMENNENNIEEARKLYEEFIEKFPENDFADDAEFLLKNLGKSEEEILKEFESRKQAG